MTKCLICGLENHEDSFDPELFPDGTVSTALARFTRVHQRLRDEGRNQRLQAALLRYILLFGTACSGAIGEGVLP